MHLRTKWSALLLILMSSAPSAGWTANLLTMPLADQVPPGGFQAAYTYIDLNPDEWGGAERLNVYETYYGLTGPLELSFVTLRPKVTEDLKAVNLSYQARRETPESWAISVGVQNLLSRTYLGSNKPSYFIAAAKMFNTGVSTGGQPGPIYRLHLGYGTKAHDGWFFGIEAAVEKEISVAAAQWAHRPIYALYYRLRDEPGSPVVRVGTWDGNQFYGVILSRLF